MRLVQNPNNYRTALVTLEDSTDDLSLMLEVCRLRSIAFFICQILPRDLIGKTAAEIQAALYPRTVEVRHTSLGRYLGQVVCHQLTPDPNHSQRDMEMHDRYGLNKLAISQYFSAAEDVNLPRPTVEVAPEVSDVNSGNAAERSTILVAVSDALS